MGDDKSAGLETFEVPGDDSAIVMQQLRKARGGVAIAGAVQLDDTNRVRSERIVGQGLVLKDPEDCASWED